MTAHVYLYTGDGESRYVLVRGRASDTFKRYAIPALWSNLQRGWLVRRERLSDLLCALQADQFVVRTVAGDPK